jgi:hypothetical protein
MNRREFMQTGTGAATGLLLLKSSTAFGYQANSAVRIGLLGCGNRGTSVAESFTKSTTAQVVALGDLFPDQLAAGHAHFDTLNASLGHAAIDPKLLFQGPHAFEKLAACKDIDLIQISTPPFFHVQHLEAAVASGKHVYCEKPVGIDVAQTRHALEIAKMVKPTQSVDVGFNAGVHHRLRQPRTESTRARWGRLPRWLETTTLPRRSRKCARALHRTNTGCATGFGTARFRVTFWWSRTFTSSTCVTGC